MYYPVVQELASNVGFPVDSIKHYGMDGDVSGVLLMADLVIYGSFQEEQSFPPLLVRAMSFETPIVVPNLNIITKYVSLLNSPSPSSLSLCFIKTLTMIIPCTGCGSNPRVDF